MERSTIDIAEAKKNFFARVKAETADLHRQTENSRLSRALMSEELTQKDYGEYLLRMKDIVEYYENNIYNQVAHVIPDIDQRRKLHYINSDLACLQEEQTIKHFSLPETSSLPALLGYMYVLEGSSLGGALIYKQVSRHIAISEEKGGAYFTAYGAELSSRWKSFLDIIGTYALHEPQANEIIQGARTAFAAICKHLD